MTYLRGHKIYWDPLKKKWYFGETGEYVPSEDRTVPCRRCNQLPTAEGYDACLEHLAGVKNACCGHGVTEGYVQKECLKEKNY